MCFPLTELARPTPARHGLIALQFFCRSCPDVGVLAARSSLYNDSLPPPAKGFFLVCPFRRVFGLLFLRHFYSALVACAPQSVPRFSALFSDGVSPTRLMLPRVPVFFVYSGLCIFFSLSIGVSRLSIWSHLLRCNGYFSSGSVSVSHMAALGRY